MAPIMLAARCTEPDATPPPIATTRPAVCTSATQPTTAPAASSPTEDVTAVPLDDYAVELPTDAWLRIEQLRADTKGGWINGHSPTPNRIVIETHNVAQFSMDVSRLQLDWSKRVWVRINNAAFELIHKRNPVIHLRLTPAGAWELVDPHRD